MLRNKLQACLSIALVSLSGYLYAEELTFKLLFTPKDSVVAEINQSIMKSRRSIHIAASKLSNKQIVNQLKAAIFRGIHVQIIVDSDFARESDAQLSLLYNSGACIYIDNNHKTFHNKYIIIDNNEVITGSYNYTRDSEKRNAENVILISSSKVADAYLSDWRSHQHHSILLDQLDGYTYINSSIACRTN